MTTVAARFSTLEIAADTMISDDSSFFLSSKLRKGDKSIYGGCGEWSKLLKAYLYIKEKRKKWDDDMDVEIIELRETGIYIYNGTPIPTKIMNDVWAVGSGSGYFLGAYAVTKDFKKSIEVACQLDSSSCEPIEYFQLRATKNGRQPKSRK